MKFTTGPWTRLHRVVEKGTHMDMLAVLSDSSLSTNIDQGNPCGVSPLSLAAGQGSCTKVEKLLEHGASVTTVDSKDRTALHYSAYGRHGAVSLMLLDAGAGVDETDEQGNTPLILAANKGSVGVIAALLERKASVNYCAPVGKMALSSAVYMGHVEAVKMLVCAGANPVKEAGLRMNALDIASCEGHAEIVSWLLQRFGRASCGGPTGGVTALVAASVQRQYVIMTILLDAGVVDDGRVLLLAINQCNVGCVKLLLEYRAYNSVNPLTRDEMRRYLSYNHRVGVDPTQAPLFKCLHPEALTPTCCKIMRLLIDHGADTSVVGIGCSGTFLQYSHSQLLRGEGEHDHTMAETPRLYGLRGLYRLLMQEEAIHATAWLWPDGAGATTTTTTTTTIAARKKMPVTVKLKTGRRPRFLRMAITRLVWKERKLNRIESEATV